ncbi:ABC transporter permease [Paenibacillus woosongensis]|uniref:ABC transporter permease n=1 Tax=Paenibacillus woosongensis TaxID=307580 RepID=A0AA95I849_9BACL|nr:ABC transporter permease [Paenibacillus woosongensis]WHX49273.1 ABC transporter permease [Paenibacillus woosongensis]
MRNFLRILSAEMLKMSRSGIWLIILASPLLSLLIGALVSIPAGADPWPIMLGSMVMLHGMLFLPIMAGLFAAFVCRYEHTGGGWKQLLVLPVSRTGVYLAKFAVVASLLALSQLLFLLALIGAAKYHAFPGAMPWGMFLKSILGGWVACLPLVALQLGVSLNWASFAAPLSLNVSLTIPNMLIVNSATYGPFYPWAQPVLAMMPSSEADFGAFNLPYQSLLITVLGSFLLFFLAGLTYFRRKEI